MKTQKGFTLVELVVVIIILGVLAAVAVPKFIDLSVDAHTAAAKAVAGSLSSASAVNFAARQTGNADAVSLSDANICSVAEAGALITGVTIQAGAAADDDEFQISGTGDCSGAALTVNCTITPYNGTAAVAPILCARAP